MNKLPASEFKSAASPQAQAAQSSQLVRSPKRVPLPEFGLVVFESRHAPGFSGQLRDDYAKFHLIIAGHACWEGGGCRYSIGPDMLFHVPAGVRHSVKDLPYDPVILYVIHYRPALLGASLVQELSRFGMLSLDLASPSINQASSVRSLYREMLFEQDAQRPGWQVLLQSHLMNLAVRSLRMAEPVATGPAFEPGSDSAERVAHYALSLRWRFFHQQTLAEAARSVHLSERRFTKLFRQATGQSWCKHIQSLRLGHAVKLLAETDKPISAVAFESGFEDLSHFHHVFKAVHDCSPLNYRKQYRGVGQ